MSGKFSLDDYVDVAERIREFSSKFPDGSLQGEGHFVRQEPRHGDDVTMGTIIGYIYRARAYRHPEDNRPGVGTAYEPIPGKTPYTRDSEVQNAETAAWGRAIVALGFETKKIASRQEVKARQPAAKKESGAKPAAAPDPDFGPNGSLLDALGEIDVLADALATARGTDKTAVLKALTDEYKDWRTDPVDVHRAKARLVMWGEKLKEASAA